jgi:hypothetical protein
MANAMNTKITTKNIEKVLAFLPLFERKELKLYQVRTDISPLDPYVYACEVDNFIQTLYPGLFHSEWYNFMVVSSPR